MANGLAVFALVLLAGCTTAEGPRTVSAVSEGDAETVSAPSEEALVALAGGTDYRIGPLDVLEISVFQVPDLNKTVKVTGAGQISMPLVGIINAGGKTVSELQDDIATKLGAT